MILSKFEGFQAKFRTCKTYWSYAVRVVLIVLTTLVASASGVNAQVAEVNDTGSANRYDIEAYGVLNYYGFRWQTDPQRRNAMDVERFAIEPTYHLNSKIDFVADIEFEHGGTGSSMDFDKLEEFGQFEQDVEHGGEVVLEQLALRLKLSESLNILLGHFYVATGGIWNRYEPHYYLTASRPEAEFALLPSVWHETGIECNGKIGDAYYAVQIINGLDATAFSSANWIKRGQQGRFETVSAQDFAINLYASYELKPQSEIRASIYMGNSADNRPKPDLTLPANVTVTTMGYYYDSRQLHIHALGIYGTLQNADAVSTANKALSNELGVKRTPVGSSAAGLDVEIGYNVFSVLGAPRVLGDSVDLQQLIAFVAFDYYDSMLSVTGNVFDNPRWQRLVYHGGVDYKLHPDCVIKLEYAHRVLGTPNNNIEDTFSVGLGFEI